MQQFAELSPFHTQIDQNLFLVKLCQNTGFFFWDFWQNSRRKKLNILTKLKEIWPKLKQNFPKSTQNIQFFFEMVKFFLKKLEKRSKFRSKLKEICRKLKFTGVFVTRGEPKSREKKSLIRHCLHYVIMLHKISKVSWHESTTVNEDLITFVKIIPFRANTTM